jgi:hypothetical protein
LARFGVPPGERVISVLRKPMEAATLINSLWLNVSLPGKRRVNTDWVRRGIGVEVARTVRGVNLTEDKFNGGGWLANGFRSPNTFVYGELDDADGVDGNGQIFSLFSSIVRD